MTRDNARAAAQEEAKKIGLPLALVKEGLHADEFADRDADGESYGYCPAEAVKLLYRFGEVVETVKP